MKNQFVHILGFHKMKLNENFELLTDLNHLSTNLSLNYLLKLTIEIVIRKQYQHSINCLG